MILVKNTKIIESHFMQESLNFAIFKGDFEEWKKMGLEGADDHYEFGKDVPYEKPLVNGVKNTLMHVHLVPIIDSKQKKNWNKNWKKYSRRTSNRCLVYADNKIGGYLLISILPEPEAHKVCKMENPEDTHLMLTFADIADKFIYYDRIIA